MKRVRYLALSGSGNLVHMRAVEVAALAGMEVAINRPNFLLLADQPVGIFSQPGRTAFLLGWIYRRDGAKMSVDPLNPADAQDIFTIEGAIHLEKYWGSYVAILHDEDHDDITVVRDPSGGMPCYYMKSQGVTAIGSDMALFRQVGLLGSAIDDEQLARHLYFPNSRTSRTCLAELNEIPAGFQLDIQLGKSELAQRWDPWDYARRQEYYGEPAAAISDLRATLTSTIGAWVSRFPTLVVGLSGGLDSSIVAAAAVQAGAKVTGLTLVTDETAGDERYYARAIANFLHIPMEEVFFSADDTDLEMSHAAHLPRPLARSFAQSGDQAYLAVASAVSADAFFTGSGGDNVFCFQQSVLPIADRLLFEGVGRGAMVTAAEVAEMAETSIIRCATLAARRAWLRKPQYRWKPKADLLSRDFVSRLGAEFSHPWLEVPIGELPGKAAHIAYLIQIQNHLEGFRRETVLPMINPLMSQPIVETCLRIPSWYFCMGGENRSIARAAFDSRLPDSILHRRTKGGPDGFLQRLVECNRSKIKDMLLGGYLAAANIIDRSAVDAAIKLEGDRHNHMHFRILELVDAEAWVAAMKAS